jgi:hypothetical protein
MTFRRNREICVPWPGHLPESAPVLLDWSDNRLDGSELGQTKVFGKRFEPESGGLRLRRNWVTSFMHPENGWILARHTWKIAQLHLKRLGP